MHDFTAVDLFLCFLCIFYLSGSLLSWWYQIRWWTFYGKLQRLWRMKPQEVHEDSSWSFVRWEVPHAIEMLCLHKLSSINYTTYIMKIRDLLVEDLWRNTTYSKTWSRKYFFKPRLRKFMLVKLKLFYTFLSPRKFSIL